MLLFLVLALYVCAAASQDNSTAGVEDCATRWDSLERSLYRTGANFMELHRAFFPAGDRPSRFIRVTYVFLDEFDEDNGCNVTYIWSMNEMLFFQPPALFMLNALFFNYPNNGILDLVLELPIHCRALIQADNQSSSECSCLNSARRLNFLTSLVSTIVCNSASRASGLTIGMAGGLG